MHFGHSGCSKTVNTQEKKRSIHMSQPSKRLEHLLSLCTQIHCNPFVHPRPAPIPIPIKKYISNPLLFRPRRTDTSPDNTNSRTTPHRDPSSEYHRPRPCHRRSNHVEGRAAVGSTCQVAGNIHPEEVRSCHAVGRSKADGRHRSIRLRLPVDRRTMVREVEDSLEVGSWEGRIALPYSVRLGRKKSKFKAALLVVDVDAC